MSEDDSDRGMLAGLVRNAPVPRGLQHLSDEEVRGAMDIVDENRLEKLQYIYDMHRSFRWEEGKTHKDLAKIWDFTPAAVRKLSVEAKNYYRMNLGETETIRKSLFDRIEHVTISAMNNTKAMVLQSGRDEQVVEYVDAPDHKTAIAGLVAMGNLAGVNAKKTDVTVKYENVSYDDQLNLMRKQIEEKRIKDMVLTEGEGKDDD